MTIVHYIQVFRALCKFVPDTIKRPMPKQDETSESTLNNIDSQQEKNDVLNDSIIEDIMMKKILKIK